MTIAAVIHQPSIGAFKTFDDLLLLGKGGRVVYHGPICDAEKYFNSIGFRTPDETNPADFYMNIVSGGVPREGFPDFKKEDLFDLWITSRGLATPAVLEVSTEDIYDVVKEDTKPLPDNICSRAKENVTRFPLFKFVMLWISTLFWMFIDWVVDLFILFKVSNNIWLLIYITRFNIYIYILIYMHFIYYFTRKHTLCRRKIISVKHQALSFNYGCVLNAQPRRCYAISIVFAVK